MDNRDTNSPAVNHLAPDSLQGLLVGALADAGIDIIAFDSDASVAFTTLTFHTGASRCPDPIREKPSRPGIRGRAPAIYARPASLPCSIPANKMWAGTRSTSLPCAPSTQQHRAPLASDRLDAENVRADFEQSAFGIIEGEAALSPLVLASYEHNTPVMLEGEDRVWQRPDSRASLFERLPFPSAICSH